MMIWSLSKIFDDVLLLLRRRISDESITLTVVDDTVDWITVTVILEMSISDVDSQQIQMSADLRTTKLDI